MTKEKIEYHLFEPVTYGVTCKKIKIPTSSEDVFLKLYGDKDYCFWLDSSLLVDGLSRWSFMGDLSGEGAHLVQFDQELQTINIQHPTSGLDHKFTQSIFDFLEDQKNLRKLNFEPIPGMPFIGGYVGYLGYELKSLSCGLESRKSKTPDTTLYFCERFLAFDHQAGDMHIIALYPEHDAASERSAIDWVADRYSAAKSQSQRANEKSTNKSPPKNIDFRLRHNRPSYIAKINQCLEKIEQGESYEICLTNEISAEVSVPPVELYCILRRRNPAPYAAFLRMGDLSIACSSPERFIQINRDLIVESKPIKGTAPRHSDPKIDQEIAEELRLDEKSRSENLMIVDLLRNDLGKVCIMGSVCVPSLMHIESYQTVHQLVSVIQGQLRPEESTISCVSSCFPGGSMTGAPKIRTLQIIDDLEQGPRGIYSGSIGYFSLTGEVDLNIVIRTIICYPKSISIGCGGAIVAMSDPSEEFEEILLKAKAPIAAICEAVGAVQSDFDGSHNRKPSQTSEKMNGYETRLATQSDASQIANATLNLLSELGGPGPNFSVKDAEETARQMINLSSLGFIIVATESMSDELIGVATVSTVQALRAGGEYGVLQELWISPNCRSNKLGELMISSVNAEALSRGWSMVEVSLPKENYPKLSSLTRFYKNQEFTQAGMRYRRLVG